MLRARLVHNLFVWLLLSLALVACQGEKAQRDLYHLRKQEVMAQLQALHPTTDSLLLLYSEAEARKDRAAEVVLLREVGKRMRDASRFDEAVRYHSKGLELAMQQQDTTEIVQALNNLGTDHRRTGSFAQASHYHYEALALAEQAPNATEPEGVKNTVIALNGIGNIALHLKNLDEAETYFREALVKEKALKSHVGQAINYANIGSIYFERKDYINARAYFDLSMEHNRLANNNLGMGLCFTHLGSIDEMNGDYRYAEKNYYSAFQLLSARADKWHWLGACIPLARIHLLQGNIEGYLKYAQLAYAEAEAIDSPFHLSELYNLQHLYYLRQQKYKEALEAHQKSHQYIDSIASNEATQQVSEARLFYERSKSNNALETMRDQNMQKTRRWRLINSLSVSILVITLSLFALFGSFYLRNKRHSRMLEEVNRMRSDFFAGITHEFRTPLTVILGLNNQLRKRTKSSPNEQEMYHEAIERQAENLLSLVNQLLGIAKLKAGVASVEWKRGDIVLFLNTLIEGFRAYAEEKKVRFYFAPQADILETEFVPEHLQKIVTNLISNALKYTHEGDLVRLFVEITSDKRLKISVADTGEGIPEKVRSKIFDMYYKQEINGGMGIGLSFSRMLVDSLKGEISLESIEGRGSVFTVLLPMVNPDGVEVSQWLPAQLGESQAPHTFLERDLPTALFLPEETDTADPSSEKYTILVVEDNKDVSLLIALLLREKYNLLFATNGKEGYDKAVANVPDLIITDLMMPEMDGFELCRELKSMTLMCHIPIVVLSVKTAEEDRVRAIKAGAHSYLIKPFSADELQARVERIFLEIDRLKAKYVQVAIDEYSKPAPSDLPSLDVNLRFIDKLTQIIVEKMSDPQFGPQQLADCMALSHSQLNRKLNGIVGKSAVSFITHVKMRCAKELLVNPDLSIIEVSEMVGYNDRTYFSRVFSRSVGCSPSQYQKQLSEKGGDPTLTV